MSERRLCNEPLCGLRATHRLTPSNAIYKCKVHMDEVVTELAKAGLTATVLELTCDVCEWAMTDCTCA